MTSQSRRLAHGDFVQAWLSWRLWLTLGLSDISIRYKRTLLGPLWITLSMSATFVALGILFSAILKNDVHSYLPYLAAGMVDVVAKPISPLTFLTALNGALNAAAEAAETAEPQQARA